MPEAAAAGLARIRLELVPFVDQDTYTALVNTADFNVVRGEESWVTAVLSGKPRRIAKRGKNIVLGRALGRAGVWRWLWR